MTVQGRIVRGQGRGWDVSSVEVGVEQGWIMIEKKIRKSEKPIDASQRMV